MSIIYVLIPLSIVLMLFAIGFFFWAVKNNQFDDLDSPALDILDDDQPEASAKVSSPQSRSHKDNAIGRLDDQD